MLAEAADHLEGGEQHASPDEQAARAKIIEGQRDQITSSQMTGMPLIAST